MESEIGNYAVQKLHIRNRSRSGTQRGNSGRPGRSRRAHGATVSSVRAGRSCKRLAHTRRSETLPIPTTWPVGGEGARVSMEWQADANYVISASWKGNGI